MIKNFYSPSQEISPLTMAVIAEKDENGNLGTWVLEEHEEYFVAKLKPSKMIDTACKFFGSSLKGRQEGTKDVCGITHKAPISIDPSSGMYFFPTLSPANSRCSWIAHSHIKKVNKANHHRAEIVFKNDRKVIVDVSVGSMLNQVQRTAQFRFLLENRIKALQKQTSDLIAEPYP